MQLEQGNRSVEEYEAEFTRLSRFVPLMVATEEEKTDLFIQGLRQEIQGSVSAHASQDFVTAYNAAVKLDASTPRNNQGSSSQTGHLARVCRSAKNPNMMRPERSVPGGGGGQLSAGGHSQARGKAFATTSKAAGDANTVVTGTLPISGYFAYTVFDSGSTHSFISLSFVCQARLEVEPLSYETIVSTPSGVMLMTREKVKLNKVEVSGQTLDVLLMVLDMYDYDIILGMDWLSAHHASINCYKKEIVFHPSRGKSFRFQGTKLGSVPKTITALKARKLIGHGAVAFLASLVAVGRVDTDVSTVPVVNEFLDVFSDKLPGLPPEREVNFGIELEPRTTPISKAPYRMAPAELKELNVYGTDESGIPGFSGFFCHCVH
ncbi:uncharacterized protein LOC111450842 [Cucurbita moschata]|uniref:Uncharacterized protein LOC111450842 n=1 Tax=Cucurbita moschata TaxID=3662 RepID=A0A6J1G4W3_CUCMO|nr:uncharacterized protein LOC111450842 [Cucurbita moschata]